MSPAPEIRQNATNATAFLTPDEQVRVQRRTVLMLATTTILGGLGIGAGFSAGALLITEVTGNAAISGLAATMNAVGAALAGIPLARLAARRGRRLALSLGNLIAVVGAMMVIIAAVLNAGLFLFAGLAVLGIATAVQLQARFSAADLAAPDRRARDLSLVVWSITIGAVVGPNLIGPGAIVGTSLGLPELSGVFVFTLLAQAAAGAVTWFGLRPDPLLAARALVGRQETGPAPAKSVGTSMAHFGSNRVELSQVSGAARTSTQVMIIALIATAHAVMVAIMAMTPLHITEHGGSITLVGLTISLHIAGMYALSPVFGMLAGRFGSPPVMLGGLGILAAAVACTAFGGDSHVVIQIGLVLLGLGWGAVTVAGAALLTEVTPAGIRPKRQGQSDTVMNASGALAGATSGVLFAIGGFPLLSLLGAILVASGVVLVLRLFSLVRR
ncbi:MFS transporter [Leucobacter sp. Z1108]|uniref:MFS transporter n=1 Tax=Leucobacter sp. Z1108 TaxID=3439066 RepID=UPI003F41901F